MRAGEDEANGGVAYHRRNKGVHRQEENVDEAESGEEFNYGIVDPRHLGSEDDNDDDEENEDEEESAMKRGDTLTRTSTPCDDQDDRQENEQLVR